MPVSIAGCEPPAQFGGLEMLTVDSRRVVGEIQQATAQLHLHKRHLAGLPETRSKDPQVISAYRDVTAAQQDQQRAVNDADTYANRVVPEAEGGAARILAEAKAYREQTILQAKGQTARYNQIYAQYKNAPDVTSVRKSSPRTGASGCT